MKNKYIILFSVVLYFGSITFVLAQEQSDSEKSIIEIETILKVDSTKLHLGYMGGRKAVNVDVNIGSWDINSLPECCTIEEIHTSFFIIRCDKNQDAEIREKWFKVVAGNKEVRIDIIQDAAPIVFDMSSKNIFFDDTGGVQTVKIETNFKNWYIEKTDTSKWVKISKEDDISIKIKCEDNPTVYSSRKAIFNIIVGDKNFSIAIEQKAKPIKLIVNPLNLSFKRKGGTFPIEIATTTGEYDIDSTKKWCIIKKNITGFEVQCKEYKDYELRAARENRAYKKDLTRYDTIKVRVMDTIREVFVKQKTSPAGLKIPYNIVGFSASYVQTDWIYNVPIDTTKPRFTHWENAKKMHGLQVGVRLDPYFDASIFGFGISTGLYYQYANAKSDTIRGIGGIYRKTIEEHYLYIPIHFIYRYDFTKTVGIFINGGIGIDWNLALNLRATLEGAPSPFYNSNIYKDVNAETSNRVILTGEYGGGIKLGRCIFSASFSRKLFKQTTDNNAIVILPNNKLKLSFVIMLL